jgi:hypothetical protein
LQQQQLQQQTLQQQQQLQQQVLAVALACAFWNRAAVAIDRFARSSA